MLESLDNPLYSILAISFGIVLVLSAIASGVLSCRWVAVIVRVRYLWNFHPGCGRKGACWFGKGRQDVSVWIHIKVGSHGNMNVWKLH